MHSLRTKAARRWRRPDSDRPSLQDNDAAVQPRDAIGRLPRFTTVFGLCGLIAFAVVWAQLLTEFPKAQLY